jgi:hypothetical protein
MRQRKAILLAPLAIAGVVLSIVWGGAASAAGTTAGREVHFYEADPSLAGNLGTVIFTGAITDLGTDQQGNPQDGTNRIILSKGSFSVDVNDLGNQLASAPVVPRDESTCSTDGSATAQVQIVPGSGTGAYKGISGTFNATGSAAAIVPRLSNGTCDTSSLPWGILIASGSGTVTYP